MVGKEPNEVQAPRTFINIPVPEEHVLKVYAYLGQLEEASAPQEKSAVPWPTETEGPQRFKPWSYDDLARFEASGTKTAETISAMLDVLVGKPGSWFGTTELVERIGVSRNELRGALSALSRHVRKHYDRTNWMFRFRWGKTEAEYAVTDDLVVQAWRKIRKAA